MKDIHLRQLTEVLMVLRNINDNIVRLEKEMFEIGVKISQIERKQSNEYKHTIVIEKPHKTANRDIKGENTNGKSI